MAATATHWLDKLRLRRRHIVKRIGKRLFRRIDLWLGQQSLVPTDPVIDASYFPWVEELRRNWTSVRAELDALLRHRDELPCFQEISPDQSKISPDHLWRTFVFSGFGERSEQSRRLCPETARLLEGVPRLETAFFSILAPGKHVPRHKGVTRGMVRCHLGLKIPSEPERCTMTVGDVRCVWREGEVLFFDDTYPHEVSNDTSEERAVLLFDFERPMRLRGRLVARLLMGLLRRTAYFKDAQRNQNAWEKRFRERVLESRA
jgi:aspartyl/asparaginyl beta-hydroxylase (cupin superfamily)